MAMTRWRDETGAMHVVTSTASGSSVWLACGARPFTYGGIESRQSVAPRGRACRTCLRYAKRRAVAFDTTK